MTGWRAYYADGARYSSRESRPEDLPRDGVLGIVKYLDKRTQAGKPYRAILSGDDHYFYWQGEWFSNSDPVDEIRRRYPGALLLRGRWTASAEMECVQAEMARAREEP